MAPAEMLVGISARTPHPHLRGIKGYVLPIELFSDNTRSTRLLSSHGHLVRSRSVC